MHARTCEPGVGNRDPTLHCLCRHAQTTQRGGQGAHRTLCPNRRGYRVWECSRSTEVRPGGPPHRSTRKRQTGNQAPTQGCETSLPPEGLWTEQAQKTSSRGAVFGKALKAKETGRCPRQRSLGNRGHCFHQEQTARAGSSVAGLSQWSLCSHKPGAGPSSQALTAGGGAG